MCSTLAVVVLFSIGFGSWGQSIAPLSPAQYAEAVAQWEAAMAAHRQRNFTAGVCASDFRNNLPACLQYEPEWCWATAVAEIASFYNKQKYPEPGNDCHGTECQVVGHKNNLADPDACCRDKDSCGQITGTGQDIVNSIQWTVGQNYIWKGEGPMSQADIDNVLNKGHPVGINVVWEDGSRHILTLGGCAASGSYFLHDPLNKEGNYQTLTYEQVASYHPPWRPSQVGKWMWTYILSGDGVSATEDILV